MSSWSVLHKNLHATEPAYVLTIFEWTLLNYGFTGRTGCMCRLDSEHVEQVVPFDKCTLCIGAISSRGSGYMLYVQQTIALSEHYFRATRHIAKACYALPLYAMPWRLIGQNPLAGCCCMLFFFHCIFRLALIRRGRHVAGPKNWRWIWKLHIPSSCQIKRMEQGPLGIDDKRVLVRRGDPCMCERLA